MQVEVTTWSLEMLQPTGVVAARTPDLDLALIRSKRPSAEHSRFLYTAVGGNWYWIDRLAWSPERWLAWLAQTGVETWVAYLEGTPAGYFELDGASGSEVEIAYFGLLPQFIGGGLGGWLLTRALARAWELVPRRVWVHTCSLDGPNALANYQARGMRLFKVEKGFQELPPEPPGPWPGARPAVSS